MQKTEIEMINVKSQNIAAVGYDPKSKTLRLRFQSGPSYDYMDVPPFIHRQLMQAESKGRFLADRIRPFFQAVRVDDEAA